jgi:hypothetical protein
MATVSNFVGILSGQDKNHHPIISLVADTPTGPQPAPPIGLPTITIVINGEKGQLLVGGAMHPGSIQVLNPGGKPVITLESTPDGDFSINNPLGAATIRLSGKGASGWFGGAGIAGDVLVFGADAKGTTAADAAVWIKGSTGDVVLQNADCAEDFEVGEHRDIEPGVVLCLSEDGPLTLSSSPYDRKVAGVVSGAGGLRPGIVLGRTKNATNRWPIALSGKVFCKVDARESPIAVGDLLTTSPTPGHAMAARDHGRAFGAVLGKALAPLQSGVGLVPILVALQ